MSNFDPFLRADSDVESFSASIEQAIITAKDNPPATNPPFDTYNLTTLGFSASDELARTVAASDKPFMNNHPSANPLVPKWVKRGNGYFTGHFAGDYYGAVVDPYRELVLPQDEEAIVIAMNCINNGVGAVMDANFAARGILAVPEIAEQETDAQVKSLRASHKLVARLAVLNDMEPSRPGRGDFNDFVGVTDTMTGEIDAKHLELDVTTGALDLTDEAKSVVKDSSVAGRGCPALRKQVQYRGRVIPMIEAFWDGSVDVIAARLAEA